MSIRHPSEGIAFEPLAVVAGAVATLAVFAAALHLAFRTARPKEKQ